MEIVLGEIGSKSILLVNDLIIPFEDSVIYSKNSDSISIKLNNTNKELFNTIKREFIKVVHKNSKKIFGTHKSINIIEELYCNPYKITPTGDFFEIKYDADAEGQVYPDVYDTFEREPSIEKKKGKIPTKK